MRVLLALALLLASAGPSAAAPVFFSGAESAIAAATVGQSSPGVADCTRSSTATADATHVKTGAYAWKLASGQNILFNWALGATATRWYQFQVYPTANPGSDSHFFKTVESGTVTQFVLQVTTAGQLAYSYKAGAIVVTGADSLILNAWNLIEVKIVNSTTVGGMEAKLNNVVQFSSFTTTGDGSGASWHRFDSWGSDVWVDDVVMDDTAYLGGAKIIARQGVADPRAPTNNGWTKNSCTGGTIDGCWSNTPLSTTSNASTTTTQDQTMRVASFLTTQAGHGSETLTAYPPPSLLAVAITYVIKMSNNATSSGTPAARRVVAGVAANGTGQGDPGTTDVCQGDLAIWTTTLANMATLEAGVSLTTGIGASQTITVEDLWVQAVYSFPGVSLTVGPGGSTAVAAVGTSRLKYVAPTSVQLLVGVIPLQVSGAWTVRAVRSPVVAAPTGLSASTTYYVYAQDSGGATVLSFSTTGHATTMALDLPAPVEVQAGDSTKTLVGMVATNASSQFQYDATHLWVLSWFSKRGLVAHSQYVTAGSALRVNNTSTLTEVNSEIRINVLTWADQVTHAVFIDPCSHHTSGGHMFVAIQVDATTGNQTDSSAGLSADSGTDQISWCTARMRTSLLAEGNHFVTVTAHPNSLTSYVEMKVFQNALTVMVQG